MIDLLCLKDVYLFKYTCVLKQDEHLIISLDRNGSAHPVNTADFQLSLLVPTNEEPEEGRGHCEIINTEAGILQT